MRYRLFKEKLLVLLFRIPRGMRGRGVPRGRGAACCHGTHGRGRASRVM